ncbi:MAG: histidine kinase [Bacteroidota bacterium]
MKKTGLFLGILFCLINTIKAQRPAFRNYNTRDGLPSSETYSVMQDKKGYMWFATDRGIARFDGYEFKIFTTADGLPDNTVFEIFSGSDNKIWFKTLSSEIGYFENDSIYSYPYNALIKSVMHGKLLSYILFTNSDHLWFADDRDETIKIFDIDPAGKLDSSKALSDPGSRKIYLNRKGERIISSKKTPGCIEVFLQETAEKLGSLHLTPSKNTFYTSRSKKDNSFFLLSNNKVFHIKNGACKEIIDCRNNEIISFLTDEQDNIWIGYRHKGVERYGADKHYIPDLAELNNYSVSSMEQDKEGGFWFTTLENGIYYLPSTHILSFTEANGLPIPKVNKVENMDSSVLLVLSDNTVLLKRKHSGFKTIKEKIYGYFDLGYQEPAGPLYVTFNKNLLLPPLTKTISLGFAKNIYIGKKHIWKYSQHTVIKCNKKGEPEDELSFTNIPRITSLYENQNGELFIGTLNGLYVYRHHGNKTLVKNSYLPGRISDIKSFGGNIVVATIGYGLFVINGNPLAGPTRYTVADGLPSMMCNVVLTKSTNDSFIWVGTNKGLCRIKGLPDKGRSAFLNLDINDGIVSNEINGMCFLGDDLWLATTRGISIIPTKNITGYQPDIPVYVENISVNGEPVSTHGLPAFTHTQNNITISFTGLHYRHNGRLRYKYRMKGEQKWYYTSNRSVVFDALLPGEYCFQVGVMKPDGQENPLMAEYSFVVLPPFWQTWWFKIISILSGLALIFFTTYRIIIINKHKHDKSLLQKRKLAELELEAIKAQINPHFIYNCLNSIQYFNYTQDYASAKKYFGLFARLIRQTMQFSQETFITLDEEINYLSNYLALEKIRFKEKLNYDIVVSPDLKGSTLVPSMLVQPYVENALKHGIAMLSNNGEILIRFENGVENGILISVEDNGPGMKQPSKTNDDLHLGMRLTGNRASSYNQLFGMNIRINIVQKENGGLKIELLVPHIPGKE